MQNLQYSGQKCCFTTRPWFPVSDSECIFHVFSTSLMPCETTSSVCHKSRTLFTLAVTFARCCLNLIICGKNLSYTTYMLCTDIKIVLLGPLPMIAVWYFGNSHFSMHAFFWTHCWVFWLKPVSVALKMTHVCFWSWHWLKQPAVWQCIIKWVAYSPSLLYEGGHLNG